jgi:tetratricopeptide (TPR) repeat protein
MHAGNAEEAIAYYQKGLAQRQPESRHYLSLAAAYVAKGDLEAASMALARYLQHNPDHRNARCYHAELLRRLGKIGQARLQFERTIADLQQETKSDVAQLVHCHGRLMELAEIEEDDYQVHLHRGIGMYWLAHGSQKMPAEDDPLTAEGLLFKAVGELTAAGALRPQEARPCWYLYSVWRGLAQTRLADGCLRAAREAAPFTFLTPAEQRSLELAVTAPMPALRPGT